eukprot:scpid5163/ scgid12039/ 
MSMNEGRFFFTQESEPEPHGCYCMQVIKKSGTCGPSLSSVSTTTTLLAASPHDGGTCLHELPNSHQGLLTISKLEDFVRKQSSRPWELAAAARKDTRRNCTIANYWERAMANLLLKYSQPSQTVHVLPSQGCRANGR